jgi:hypothetical protein
MLPARELNTTCLRCGLALAPEVQHCPSCGADRALEVAVAAELVPTIGSLRRWLGGLGLLHVGVGALSYEHFGGRVTQDELNLIVGPFLVLGVVYLALAFVAHRIPFAAAVVATSFFAAEWTLTIVGNGLAAFIPNFWLAMRIVVAIVLAGAVRSAYRARALRRRAAAGIRSPEVRA